MTKLTPPDYTQCQAEIRPAHGPFVLGPRPRYARCTAAPAFLAVEVVAGADGQHGSMSLCLDCSKVMLDDADLRKRVQLQPIEVKP